MFHAEFRLSTKIIAKFCMFFTGLIAFVVVCYLRNSFFKSSFKYSALVGHNNLRNRSLHDETLLYWPNHNNEKMVNGNCAVVSCKNSNYKLKNWKKEACLVHLSQTHESCPCPRPFSLHRFPSAKLNAERRKEWIRLMNRTTAPKTAWTPGQSDLVCSCHFVDGMPTLQNPDPTLKLG